MTTLATIETSNQITVKAKEGHTGVMVAFMLPAKVASKLALSPKDLPAGIQPEPTEGLHITLMYLGQVKDLAHAKLAIIQSLAAIAGYASPVTGVVSGVGLFNVSEGSDGKQPFYASFSSPALAPLHERLVKALASQGVIPASSHGFTPHITLAYLPEGIPPPVVSLPNLEITFDNLVLAWGDEQTSFPLFNPVVALKEYLAARTYKAGTQISGDLWRAENGQFAAGNTGGGSGSTTPTNQATQGQENRRQADKKVPEETAQAKANAIMEKLIGSDALEAMTFLADDPNTELKPEYQADLIRRGLATLNPITGKLEQTVAAKALLSAAKHGDEKAAKKATQDAAHHKAEPPVASKPKHPAKGTGKGKAKGKSKPSGGAGGGNSPISRLLQRLAANQAARHATTTASPTHKITTPANPGRAGGGRGQQVISAKSFEDMQSPETILKEFSGTGISLKEAKTDDLIWLVTTYKHGTHNQETHGRRLLGGRVKKLTGRVASLDPVKAKKHVAFALLRDPKSTPAQRRAARRVLSKEEIIAAISKRRAGGSSKPNSPGSNSDAPKLNPPSETEILNAASDDLFKKLFPRTPSAEGGKDRKPLTDEDVRQATIDAMLRAANDKFDQPKTGGRMPRRNLTPEQKREFAKLVADAEQELLRDSKVTPMPEGKASEPDLPDFVDPDGNDVFLKNKTYTLRGDKFDVEPPKTDEDRRRLGWVAANHPNESLRQDATAMLALDKKYAPPAPKPKPLPSQDANPLPANVKNGVGYIASRDRSSRDERLGYIKGNGVRIDYWESSDGSRRRAYLKKETGFKNRPYQDLGFIDLNDPKDTSYEGYLRDLELTPEILRANLGQPRSKVLFATKSFEARLREKFIETLKHGTHNQKTHGRGHLGGRVEELVKRGIGKLEARKLAAVGALNDPNSSPAERNAAKRIVPRWERASLTTGNTTGNRKPKLALSKGNVAVLGDFEYFKDDKGNLYRAPKNNPIDTKGYRSGGRLEATPATADRAIQLAQAAYDKFNPPEVKPARTPVNRPAKTNKPGNNKTALTKAFGSDPNRTYEFKNRVVDLDDLITSNNDNGTVNPAYTQELQPRLREREASKRQVDKIAKTFVPESALWDFHQLDKGPAIIGPDGMVESGNGRTLAMRKMRQEYPEKWAEYQKKLKESLDQAGLSEADLKGIKNPVLVRERVSNVDRAAFAKEANSPPVLQMSALEQALVDSKMVSDVSLERFEVADDQTIDQALRSQKNKGFVSNFVGMLSDAERAPLMRGDGSLSQQGLWRIKAALFTKLFPGEAGTRLADTFLESLDSTIKNFESGISSAMPKLSRADGLINSGRRNKNLSITDDLSKAIDMLARLKEAGPEVKKYLSQSSMFARELTPFQESLLAYFDDIGRNPKKIKEFMTGYADAVINAQDLNQISMFGDMGDGPTKESIVMRLIGRSVNEPALAMKAASSSSNTGKRTIPKLKKKGKPPEPDSIAAALKWDEVAPKETLLDFVVLKKLKETINGGMSVTTTQNQEATLTLYKEAKTNKYRWVIRTSTAFRDKDGHIVSTKALADAVDRMDARRGHGPVDWWHVAGMELGPCDFSMLHGRTLIESGTFDSDLVATRLKGVPLEASLAFRHPITEPDRNGIFHNIDIFARSLLPRNKASNLFTGLDMIAS